jgi:Dioxygenase
MKLLPTASQTVGPYLTIGLGWLTIDRVAAPGCPGQHLKVGGRVLDGDGVPVTDALVEIWQADAHGRYAHPEDTREVPLTPGFRGFGRVPTDAEGRFRFFTIKPGPVADPQGGLQAPHLLRQEPPRLAQRVDVGAGSVRRSRSVPILAHEPRRSGDRAPSDRRNLRATTSRLGSARATRPRPRPDRRSPSPAGAGDLRSARLMRVQDPIW